MGDSSGGGLMEGVRGRRRPEVGRSHQQMEVITRWSSSSSGGQHQMEFIIRWRSSSDGGHHQLKKSSSDGGQNQTEFIISQRVITRTSPSARGYQLNLIMIQRSSLVRGHHSPNGIVGQFHNGSVTKFISPKFIIAKLASLSHGVLCWSASLEPGMLRWLASQEPNRFC
jgi:hypothetical protein